ncbi:hypothetical protein ABER61_15690 [Brevibacillus formosus]|uniref:Uncharacterized protein n=1 Tax=Brevibacillus formosus TaxID=54913 RepID=A0A837KME3_9BACL|nr:hypothetical protein [Brevibacillus formosus]KLH98837.1 hypothetical protein AA984_09880 [Brevibacillus formosus]MED1958138.1 hypothetical protein [Brevibacillus formosus]PSJ93614.1 hypothetical protein C7R91_20340 [Brevibacillus formosus]GED59461.1 hypothetical protein BFO01nite_35930 [Brevibacillus formosus]
MRKVFRISGLAVLISVMTATTVFAANQSSTAYARGGGYDASSGTISGQGQMGKVKFNSSGGGWGFYSKSCSGAETTYSDAYYIPKSGGSIELDVPMPSNCQFKLHITSGPDYPVAGTIQNHS